MHDDWAINDTLGSPAVAARSDGGRTLTGLHATASSPESQSRPPLKLPAVVGPYRLRQKLGEGGMGEVHEAFHETLERHVAIKFLRAQLQDSNAGKRLLTEARATNRINHPGLIEVSDSGVLPDGTAYLVMELVRGETLARRAQRMGGTLPLALTLHLGWQIASTLVAAHQKGIVHRDLKPENVMLVPDNLAPLGERAKLLDFGLAKLLIDAAQSPGMTQSQQVLGTPLYMSPEQCRGAGAVDEKTDVYSLGVLLYALLAGRPPFTGEGIGDLIHQHIGHAPPPLAGFDPTLPGPVVDLVHRLLSKSPAVRPSMAEVVEELAARYAELAPASSRSDVAHAIPQPARTDVIPSELGANPGSAGEKKESAPVPLDGFLVDSSLHSQAAAVNPVTPSPVLVGSHPSLEGGAAGVFAGPPGWRRLLWLGLPALLIVGLLTPRWLRPPPARDRPLSPAITPMPGTPTPVTPTPGATQDSPPAPLAPPDPVPPPASPPAPVVAPVPADVSAPASAPLAAPARSTAAATALPIQGGQRPVIPRGAAPAKPPARRPTGKRASAPRRTIFRVIDD